jgi:hypothetical protein
MPVNLGRDYRGNNFAETSFAYKSEFTKLFELEISGKLNL